MAEFWLVFSFFLGLSAGLVILSVSITVCAAFLLFIWGTIKPNPDISNITDLDIDGNVVSPVNLAAKHMLHSGHKVNQ